MQTKLLIKIAVLFALFVALQIPLLGTHDIVRERASYRSKAVAEVSRSQAGAQNLYGPVLIVPYQRFSLVVEVLADGRSVTREQAVRETLTLLPEQLEVVGDMQVETRRRGIFPVPVYTQHVTLRGQFQWPADYGVRLSDNEHIEWQQPRIALGVSAQRGIKRVETLRWAQESLALLPGSALPEPELSQGLHAEVPLAEAGATVAFEFELSLSGSEAFTLTPLGVQTALELRGDWPHPSFNGAQLPEQREVDAAAFSARWSTSHLATNLGVLWSRCLQAHECGPVRDQAFGVSLVDPVDIYTLTERAVKYGFLFIGITFAAFFLFEMRAGIAVHPIQYGLVGLALGMFFLLLVSFAEQVGFTAAYVIAAGACIALLGVYTSSVLHARSRAAGLCGLLAVLYGALYVILQLEDTALLIGACLLFVLLGSVMLLTRRYDWYSWRTEAGESGTGT